jgi:hypothetical protein
VPWVVISERFGFLWGHRKTFRNNAGASVSHQLRDRRGPIDYSESECELNSFSSSRGSDAVILVVRSYLPSLPYHTKRGDTSIQPSKFPALFACDNDSQKNFLSRLPMHVSGRAEAAGDYTCSFRFQDHLTVVTPPVLGS